VATLGWLTGSFSKYQVLFSFHHKSKFSSSGKNKENQSEIIKSIENGINEIHTR